MLCMYFSNSSMLYTFTDAFLTIVIKMLQLEWCYPDSAAWALSYRQNQTHQILFTGIRIWIDSVIHPRSSSTGHSTSAWVTVTVTETLMLRDVRDIVWSSLSLDQLSIIHFQTSSEMRLKTVFDSHWKHCFSDTLEVLMTMRYINWHSTYLLTYLLTWCNGVM